MKIVERNLQEIGKSLFVSLPKEWINGLKLKKGDKIKIMQTEQGILSIAPEFIAKDKSREIEIDFDAHIKRRFFREYFMGNEKITINLGNVGRKDRRDLHEFLNRFISIQIIDESDSKIVLKSFKIEELSIEECLKRLYFLSASMIEEVDNGDQEILGEIRQNMTRFYYMLVMQIRRFLDEGKFTKENQISLVRAMDFRMVAEKIQRIGEVVLSLDIKNSRALRDVLAVYKKTFFCFLREDYLHASDAWKRIGELEGKLNKSRNSGDLRKIVRHIKEISGLIR